MHNLSKQSMYLAEYLIEIKEISCVFNLAILLLKSGLLSPLNTFISWFEIGFVILSLCLSHTVLSGKLNIDNLVGRGKVAMTLQLATLAQNQPKFHLLPLTPSC